MITLKFQPLKPWVQGNESVTPKNFYRDYKPSCEMGSFIALNVAVDLHLADKIDTGNLNDSWIANQQYIEMACDIAGIDLEEDVEESCFSLDNEEKHWILEQLGSPPECCYNLYFVTIYNETEEKLVYIGKTDARKSRFANGHSVALRLHNPIYASYKKRVHFGTIMFLTDDKEYLPLEFIQPFDEAEKYLNEMESLLIRWFNPELNVRCGNMGMMKQMFIHIQNFTESSDFLNDYMVQGY